MIPRTASKSPGRIAGGARRMNYWNALTAARDALKQGAFRDAESAFDLARNQRDGDNRRVFLSETLPDGLKGLWGRLRRDPAATDQPGRWQLALTAFEATFVEQSDIVLQRVEQLLALGHPSDPDETSDLLASALYLSVDSRLVQRRLPVSPILEALLRLLPVTGKLCDRDLITPDLPLTSENRQQIVQLAVEGLERLAATERPLWAESLLALLDHDPVERDPIEDAPRLWLAAILADRYLENAEEVISRWEQADQDTLPESQRAHGRLRRLEILVGLDRRPLAVPRHGQARRLALSLDLDDGSEDSARLRAALAVVEYRQPRLDPACGWISAAAGDDGSVRAVFWWGDEPRDVAVWQPGEDTAALAEFLAPAEERIIWSGNEAPSQVRELWPSRGHGRALTPYLEAVLEPSLPSGGWHDELGRRLALACSGPWRDGWSASLSHPLLSPPGHDGRLADDQLDLESAIRAGLLWLAVLRRIDAADPALRAGLGELGRRGDAAAAFLHRCAVLGAPDKVAVDATFAPWTLPLLWTRPDPLTAAGESEDVEAEREDLTGQDVAVVVTGHPGRALAAWGQGDRRWRVVLDRLDRLGQLRRQARESFGPVTVLPRGGLVHDLGASLALLDELVDDPANGLLAVCHWIRLVESHNGDLLDCRILRPRKPGACLLLDLYAERVHHVPRLAPTTSTDDVGWAGQYGQRVRRSGLVTGLAHDLPLDASDLDARWGVYDGSEASWVFLDSAAVHWKLESGEHDASRRVHELLAPRGRRHLSLLTAEGLFPDQLATWYDTVLAPYGRPYYLALPDIRAPHLRLAGAGPMPDAHLDPVAALTAPLAWLQQAGTGTQVRLPSDEMAREFWRTAATRRFGPASWTLADDPAEQGPPARLVVPRLMALENHGTHGHSMGTSVAQWQDSDRRCRERLRSMRQLAALETAALLAEPVAGVDILDGRWWRRLASTSPSITEAFVAAGVDENESIDLADALVMDGATSLHRSIQEWFSDQGRVPGLVPGWDGLPLGDAQPLACEGVHRHVSPATTLWRDLAAHVLAAWEGGTMQRHLLVVASTPPPGLAALAMVCGSDAGAVLDPAAPSAQGPIIWARPEDLRVAAESGWNPPDDTVVLGTNIDSLLPHGPEGWRHGAWLLRWLATGRARRLDLLGGWLSPAWSTFLAETLAADGAQALALEPGGWTSLRRGASSRSDIVCPQCNREGKPEVEGLVCPGCGYGLAGPGPRPRKHPIASRASQLFSETDLGRETPLEIWGSATALSTVAQQARSQGAVQDRDVGSLALPDGRHWTLQTIQTAASAQGDQAVVLELPDHPDALVPMAPTGVRPELTLLFDLADLSPDKTAVAQRLLQLLATETWLPPLPAVAALLPADSHHIPLARLAWQTGASQGMVRRTLDHLRWAGILVADQMPEPISDTRPSGPRRVLLQGPAQDLELKLAGLAARLEPALSPLLAGGLPGSWQDAAPPDEGDQTPLMLDRFLGMVAHWTLDDGTRLLYRAPDGAWFSSRRQVGWLGDRETLVRSLVSQFDSFALWTRNLLADAGQDDRPTALNLADYVDSDAERWLVLGAELGFWTLAGPLSLDDEEDWLERLALAQLADSATLRPASPAVNLVLNLAREHDTWTDRLRRTPVGGTVPPGRPAESAPRLVESPTRWWRRGDGQDPSSPVTTAVSRRLETPEPTILVVSGLTGCGRIESLLAGLLLDPAGREAEIWCPDAATLARWHLAARSLAPTWQPDLRLWSPDSPLPQRRSAAPGQRPVMVIAEVQRYPQEVRYRLQDLARDSAAFLTVDPAEMAPGCGWEDLFLTTPRRDDVFRLRTQVRQAQLPWRVTRPLLESDLADSRPRRKDRGQVESRRAGNLDECAAAMTAAAGSGTLGELVDITVPLVEDVLLLQRAMADRGWAVVERRDLDDWLRPGILEWLAAMADAHRRRHGVWPGAEGRPVSSESPGLLATLLPDTEATQWSAWLRTIPDVVLDDAATFHRHLRRSPWGHRCCGRPSSREIAEVLLAGGGSDPADLLTPAAWQAWRRWLAVALDRPDLEVGPPVACLGAAEEPPGRPCESVAYICFGSEPATVHQKVLSRVTDRLLVLYQEHSPLPGDREHDLG